VGIRGCHKGQTGLFRGAGGTHQSENQHGQGGFFHVKIFFFQKMAFEATKIVFLQLQFQV
jgi:hypothetical protein